MSVLQHREWLTQLGQPLVDELEDLVIGVQTGFRRLLDRNGKFKLKHAQWEDLRMPAVGINPPGAASDPSLDTTDGRWIFSATESKVLALQVQIPHTWVEGTAIEPHVHWSPTDTGTGNVLWRLEHKIAGLNGVFPAAWTAIDALSAANGLSDQHVLADFPAIARSGQTVSAILLLRLIRLGGEAADSYTGTAKLNYFDIHYQQNSLGSNTEYTK
jgi:hypothetical protein